MAVGQDRRLFSLFGKSFFRDYTLAQAEAEVVAACIDNADALGVAADILHVDDFRSRDAYDLRRIFYTLIGWWGRGAYDPATNRDRLLSLFQSRAEGVGFLESLWCSWAVAPEYVATLCDVITEHNRLHDAVLTAHQALDTDPLAGPGAPMARPQDSIIGRFQR